MAQFNATERTVHYTERRVVLDRHALKEMIIAGLRLNKVLIRPDSEVEVTFQPQTEGSPEYTVGTKAIVTIKDLHESGK